jgi:hypothetical protein
MNIGLHYSFDLSEHLLNMALSRGQYGILWPDEMWCRPRPQTEGDITFLREIKSLHWLKPFKFPAIADFLEPPDDIQFR